MAILFTMILTISSFRDKFQHHMARIYNRAINYVPIRYCEDDLTPVSKHRLKMVDRKTLVLDMDETLIKSFIEYHSRRRHRRKSKKRKPLLAPDFCFYIPVNNATVYVYKRPHVDFFLDRVSKWYNLTVFTAATEIYASRVLDYLDAGRNILNRRFYRHHCVDIYGIRAKFVSLCHKNLANVLLLDDCHMANSFNEGNAIRIKPYEMGTKDIELLCMLPFLDALRFTRDVRSILGRNTKYKGLKSAMRYHYHFI
ncbi:CTD nuclear envelope phosphatase 1 homolog [Drosophila innubila]|uniref:CTD nuclear envelope phosphatase 1 homolog n=1 Tax=Drosophila innubila TaxID=198719 RepID=UPI00148C8E5B|nr:CTD nuclear envelope phosphatase 1 homolog [Drosophila innubila]